MRERVAIAICLLAVLVGITLSLTFALHHNQQALAEAHSAQPSASALPEATTPASAPAPESPTPVLLAQGRQIFEEQRCTACHSIGGQGNPRNPLDNLADKLSPDQMRDWIVASGPALDQLPPTIVRRKQPYQSLPELQMHALIEYLVSQTNQPPARTQE